MPSPEDYQTYLNAMETELQDTKIKNQQLSNSMTAFSGMPEDNLIKWQLDLREELDRIYHLLMGQQPQEDENGNINYVEAKLEDGSPDDRLKCLNDFGVKMVMNIIYFYINKNTILSNYDEKTINEKVYDLGIDLADLMFNRSEDIGLETPEKRKMYMIVIREITDAIHSTYLRALYGGERSSLKTARFITQNDNGLQRMMAQSPQMMSSAQSKFKLFSPKTWGRR